MGLDSACKPALSGIAKAQDSLSGRDLRKMSAGTPAFHLRLLRTLQQDDCLVYLLRL